MTPYHRHATKRFTTTARLRRYPGLGKNNLEPRTRASRTSGIAHTESDHCLNRTRGTAVVRASSPSLRVQARDNEEDGGRAAGRDATCKFIARSEGAQMVETHAAKAAEWHIDAYQKR